MGTPTSHPTTEPLVLIVRIPMIFRAIPDGKGKMPACQSVDDRANQPIRVIVALEWLPEPKSRFQASPVFPMIKLNYDNGRITGDTKASVWGGSRQGRGYLGVRTAWCKKLLRVP
ncbi:uncharacterized protein BO88DRAFT_274574 [Aspergillus vadensis CBS 113365]|uniref:Uncharacterized protein n=1 Tax=Aspergillus vadensis (strain CBS 113365 / IMI 142717 / IBT 24658) TaxID=1448311 RepID=A0A319BBL5_ASPVC|nr:hypothetical protein BO88DRAFT_274574 [Aspergillus vadensis CBS 113365]PYH70085.1 hypothetical protein BO88DRAFT_274574 [Aspergillus vadensis CBS 113365]